MNIPTPHFFLFSQAERKNDRGEWSFALKAADGSAILEASDAEPEVQGERLELLAVVRGLEALDQPSRVTLVTASRYVKRGISHGLPEWGRNNWTWEHFGEMVPVKNRDLWQRLDRALKIHDMHGPVYRVDAAHGAVAADHDAAPVEHEQCETTPRLDLGALWAAFQHWITERCERAWLACAQLGTSLLPYPWLD